MKFSGSGNRFAFGLSIAATLLSTTSSSYAQTVPEELSRLHKCYAMFVKESIEVTDPLWIKVSTKQMSGTDACMAIFDSAKLGSDGKLASTSGVYSEIGPKVLARFLEFQRSQFEVADYISIQSNNYRETADVIDANEPAYHYLYSLFKPNEPFSNVVTRHYGLKGLRYGTQTRRTQSVTNISTSLQFFQGAQLLDNSSPRQLVKDWFPWTVVPAQAGLLVGLSEDTRQNIPAAAAVSFLTTANANQHFGAGLLGTQAYLTGNNNKAGPVTGGLNSYRVFAKNAMSDLLCKTVPALRSSDVLSLVKMDSKLPFRQGISCMQCHATMDPMAGAIRDVRAAAVASKTAVGQMGVRYFAKVPNAGSAASAPYPDMGEDNSFSVRPADASLFYRSYDGSLVSVNVRGLDELGEKIAQTDDFYACAAKRYYSFLTGIDVDLSDLKDPINGPKLTNGQLYFRNKVISLGQQLKQDQSLRSLIKNVIASETFIYPDRSK